MGPGGAVLIGDHRRRQARSGKRRGLTDHPRSPCRLLPDREFPQVRDFVRLALYDPNHGYFSKRSGPVGVLDFSCFHKFDVLLASVLPCAPSPNSVCWSALDRGIWVFSVVCWGGISTNMLDA
ncbi:hypothetical protein ZWY2020_033352 [Hordeum vulgare]|nr:hypothetical protein ZWY2020_033352 [Hordeum vulgare]